MVSLSGALIGLSPPSFDFWFDCCVTFSARTRALDYGAHVCHQCLPCGSSLLCPDVVRNDRPQSLQFGICQNLGLLHPENLIRYGYLSENIIFSDAGEVDRKVKPKVSAGPSGNLMKCMFPYLSIWPRLLFNGFRPLHFQVPM